MKVEGTVVGTTNTAAPAVAVAAAVATIVGAAAATVLAAPCTPLLSLTCWPPCLPTHMPVLVLARSLFNHQSLIQSSDLCSTAGDSPTAAVAISTAATCILAGPLDCLCSPGAHLLFCLQHL
jgi:hypothetical protein